MSRITYKNSIQPIVNELNTRGEYRFRVVRRFNTYIIECASARENRISKLFSGNIKQVHSYLLELLNNRYLG